MRNQNRITPAQARQLMQQRAILWDVRTPAEYAAGHIPSARNVPLDRLEEELPNLPSNGHPVIVCCRSGQRSAIAADVRPWLYQLLGWPADTVIRRSP